MEETKTHVVHHTAEWQEHVQTDLTKFVEANALQPGKWALTFFDHYGRKIASQQAIPKDHELWPVTFIFTRIKADVPVAPVGREPGPLAMVMGPTVSFGGRTSYGPDQEQDLSEPPAVDKVATTGTTASAAKRRISMAPSASLQSLPEDGDLDDDLLSKIDPSCPGSDWAEAADLPDVQLDLTSPSPAAANAKKRRASSFSPITEEHHSFDHLDDALPPTPSPRGWKKRPGSNLVLVSEAEDGWINPAIFQNEHTGTPRFRNM